MSSKTRFMKRAIVFLCLGLFLSGFALTAFAQEEAAAKEPTKYKRRPGLAFKLGAFFPSVSANFRVDSGPNQGTEVDAESDLGLGQNATTFRGDGDIRIASWFSLELGYYGLSRSKSKVIDKDIHIGDKIFNLNQTLNTKLNQSYYNVNLKFYFVHNPRLDLGVYAGAVVSRSKLTVKAEELDRQLISISTVSSIIPSIGLHASYNLIPNLYLYGEAGYFYLKPGKRTKFESATLNINLDYYFWKFLGIGARYEYNTFDLGLDVADYHGTVKYNISGFQTYLTIGF